MLFKSLNISKNTRTCEVIEEVLITQSPMKPPKTFETWTLMKMKFGESDQDIAVCAFESHRGQLIITCNSSVGNRTGRLALAFWN